MKKQNAVALRAITHADDTFAPGATILGMDPGQFADWRDAGLVREATDKEVASAKGETATAAKPKAARKVKPRAPNPVAVPAAPAAPVVSVPPAEPVADA